MDRKSAWCLLLLVVPSYLVFGPILISNQTFSYRDTGRFYHRQFEWNRNQWQQGKIPLWNPAENLGEPVVAEASSSVFYPGQILFLIPGISVGTAMVLYGMIHGIIAGFGAFELARCFGCRRHSALLAGMAYSLSGSLLFQTCNIVFLVGGAWLPWCFRNFFRLYQTCRIRDVVWLAVTLTMPVLGGDPQTAYHAVLGASFFLIRSGFRKADRQAPDFSKRIYLPGMAVVLALGLSAIQVLPSWQATGQSTRAHFSQPRTLWESGNRSWQKTAEGIFGHPEPFTHHDHLYQFSLPPWSLVELVWPGSTGRIQERYSRWSDGIPAGDRTWTPSVYCGCLVLVLAMLGLVRRSNDPRIHWCRWMLILFATGALGWFGLGWIWHEIRYFIWNENPATSALGAPVGGVYWFFVVALPGYVNFRYPAKLFAVASLMLSVLAAREFQAQLRQQSHRYLLIMLRLILGISLAGLVTIWIFSIPISSWIDSLGSSVRTEFGPLDGKAAWSAILTGLIHAILVSLFFSAIILQVSSYRIRTFLFLGLSLLEILVANWSLVITADNGLWQRSGPVVEKIASMQSEKNGDTPVRIYRTDPLTWSTLNHWYLSGHPGRSAEVIGFEVETLLPRHHLGFHHPPLAVVESFRSIEDLRFAQTMAFWKQQGSIRTNDSYDVPLAPGPISLGVYSCRYLLIPKWGKPGIPREQILLESDRLESRLVENPWYRPRFRIATSLLPVEPIEDLQAWMAEIRNRKLLTQQSEFSGSRSRPMVEGFDPRVHGNLIDWPDPSNDSDRTPPGIRVLRESATGIDLEIQSDGGLLVVADKYDPDWVATRLDADRPEPLPIFRTNLLIRSIPLKKGKMRIRLSYHPRMLRYGALISLGCFLIAVLALMPISRLFRNRGRQ